MSKMYLLQLGIVEPTTIYELVPRKVVHLENQSLHDITVVMRSLRMRNVFVDSAHPKEIDILRTQGFNVIKGRVPEVVE